MDEKKTSEAGAASAASTTTKTTKTAEPENKLNTPSVVPGVPNESENALATYLGLDHLISYSRTVYKHTTVHDKIPTFYGSFIQSQQSCHCKEVRFSSFFSG